MREREERGVKHQPGLKTIGGDTRSQCDCHAGGSLPPAQLWEQEQEPPKPGSSSSPSSGMAVVLVVQV